MSSFAGLLSLTTSFRSVGLKAGRPFGTQAQARRADIIIEKQRGSAINPEGVTLLIAPGANPGYEILVDPRNPEGVQLMNIEY